MADKRINALTTTSASVGDDYFAIDGATNGTRALSAFSPTFGGNATVTGTLTSNGSFAATGSMVSTYGAAPQFSITPSGGRPIRFDASVGNVSFQANGGGWFMGTRFLGSAGTLRGNIWAGGTDDTLDTINIGDGSYSQWLGASSTKIAIPLTTASTTTSTGALVVGNGTSGGLGVGGAITLGSSLTSTASDGKIVVSGSGNTTGTKELQFVRADGGDSTVLGLAGSAYAGVLTGLGNNDAYLYTSSAYAFRIFVGTTNRFDFTATQFKINPSTASTSTSSGALVVSGGVGVAGAMYVGGKLVVSGSGENVIAGNTVFSTGQIRVTNAYTPASASDTSPPGSITWDNLYIYVAVGTNTWKRVAISSW